MAPPLHIAHMIAFCGAAQGGPVNSLNALSRAQVAAGDHVHLFSTPLPTDGPPADFDPAITIQHVPAHGAMGFRLAPRFGHTALPILQSLPAGHTVLHSHSLWTDLIRHAGNLTRTTGLPHIMSPCGTLTPDALRFHGWKKKPIWALYQQRVLREAFCIHAKSERELDDIRAIGLTNPVAVIPNPLGLRGSNPARDTSPADLANSPRRSDAATRTVLYLGRLHPVKGLERLLAAWSQIDAAGHRARLILAGPDEGGYRAQLERIIAKSGITDSVEFAGELDDEEKWVALRNADLFVMPSDFENFGSAIAEAAWCGKPVITTHGTPWQVLQPTPNLRDNAGWWVPTTPDAIADALLVALQLPIAELEQMGQNARQLAASLEPESVAAKMKNLYLWSLGLGPQPAEVTL